MRVLIIDSDRVSSAAFRQFFGPTDVDITVTSTAQQAIHALDEERFEVIVLEPVMAGHNGVEFLYELRSYSEWQRIPIIIYTQCSLGDLAITDELRRQLAISAVCYRPEVDLSALLQTVKSISRQPVAT